MDKIGKRVLVISDRKTQCRAQAAAYDGFYCERKTDVERAKKHRCVVVELAHVHWFADLKPVDVMILDNMRTVLTLLTTKSESDHTNMSILVTLMKAASVTMPMDADKEIDALVPIFLQSVEDDKVPDMQDIQLTLDLQDIRDIQQQPARAQTQEEEREEEDEEEKPHGLPNDDCVCCQGNGIAYVSGGMWAHCMECFGTYFPVCPPNCKLDLLAEQYD